MIDNAVSESDQPAAFRISDFDTAGFRRSFVAGCAFALDDFQVEALDIIDENHSVLVAAPTGSGKTLVADYAVARARALQARAFYTTPIKALSNQKYRDFSAIYGEANVGLLTGDISLNPDAPIIIMTTEVLRNMIYANRRSLDDLACVILDEVHFLADRYRGSVWEEIILSAPEHIMLVSLSATVSNAEELARWMEKVRGTTGAVIETKRPIRLEQLYVVGDRQSGRLRVMPTFVGDGPNKEASAFDATFERGGRSRTGRAGSAALRHSQQRSRGGASKPRRSEVIERFSSDDLLPAIYFLFSRAGCDDAVRQCLDDGVRLTTPEEREELRDIADRHVEQLSDSDLKALSYSRFMHALESGIAAHHAGMVPIFREIVEEAFTGALIKVVFATETLALGINMPARSVIIESLSKFGGAGHKDLTPGEYTQLTGRAGRRGTDDVGYAVVLWSPLHHFEDVASLASARSSALRSSFRPNYNMVVNLVRRYEKPDAYKLVRSSFAQFVSDASLASQLDSVVDLLSERGYLAGWNVTDSGNRLSGIYHEADLLITEALGAGLFNGLDIASLAALCSCFTFEARRSEHAPDYPTPKLGRRFDDIELLSRELRSDERLAGIPRTRKPDSGFMRVAYEWARGAEFGALLSPGTRNRSSQSRGGGGQRSGGAMSGGDFVRNMKQLLDLLRQIAVVASDVRLGDTARRAAEELFRGVVAASSGLGLLELDEVGDDPR